MYALLAGEAEPVAGGGRITVRNLLEVRDRRFSQAIALQREGQAQLYPLGRWTPADRDYERGPRNSDRRCAA